MIKDLKNRQKIVEDFVVTKGKEVHERWQNLKIIGEKDKGADPTTNFDVELEENFKEFITSKYPEDSIVGEETENYKGKSEFTWYIDPIDGTKYFANMVPLWGMTVSLLQNNTPLLGIIYNPTSDQLYSAIAGEGAFLNNKEILKIKNQSKENTQVFWDYINLNKTVGNLDAEILQQKVFDARYSLVEDFYRVREVGSGQYSLTWMVQMNGAFVSPVRRKSKYMDISAGLLLAQEAGAEVIKRDLTDELDYVIAAHPSLINDIDKKFNFLFSE